MSESDGERAARSVALERAYVHEVYEQCAERTARSKHWPRVCKFLEELEPGALVCDIGCGDGKYLGVNENVFKVGADRCERLTDIARRTDNEVMRCDNLALPFRDESFDAVLSIAVVHHFATTERRVNALKELARVLRIGGRLVISVWAMEQRHRKFESQDVLVPWPRAYCLNTGSAESRGTLDSFDQYLGDYVDDDDPRRAAQRRSVITGKREQGGGTEGPRSMSRGYWIDPIFSPSPSTSSLSSPNETCYSFFRRALQKLAGGKRDSTRNRAWFLESRHNGAGKDRQRGRKFRGRDYDDDDENDDDIGDVNDIPIELRRLEEDNAMSMQEPIRQCRGMSGETVAGLKSKSLGDIPEIQRLDLVRSRSSIPGFSSDVGSRFCLLDEESNESPAFDRTNGETDMPAPVAAAVVVVVSSPSCAVTPTTSFTRSSSSASGDKPRLVKQEAADPSDEPSSEIPDEPPPIDDVRRDSDDPAEIRQQQQEEAPRRIEAATTAAAKRRRRGNVRKQSSMNEELMSMERLVERERVRKNIMKQASLNEEMICKPSSGQTLRPRSIRDGLYSGNATMQRFQLMKSDLTNRIRQSTTNMENRVSSIGIKNGFAKILQSWKQSAERLGDAASVEAEAGNEVKEKKLPGTEDNADASVDEVKRSTAGGGGTNVIGGARVAAAASKTTTEGGESSLERRLSREDGSDSSKDSSLQSDTSVDSEDSFASVIYVPKEQLQQQHSYDCHRRGSCSAHDNQYPSLIDVTATTVPPLPSGCHRLRTASAPPSPRIKHSPDSRHYEYGARLKLAPVSPLLKQFPATSKSLPPPSPPGLSPRNSEGCFVCSPTERYAFPLPAVPTCRQPSPNRPDQHDNPTENNDESTPAKDPDNDDGTSEITTTANATSTVATNESRTRTTNAATMVITAVTATTTMPTNATDATTVTATTFTLDATTPAPFTTATTTTTTSMSNDDPSVRPVEPELKMVQEPERKDKLEEADAEGKDEKDEDRVREEESKNAYSTSNESINEQDTRRSRLNRIKELLKQKPGFATRSVKSPFPLVRRASAASGRSEGVTVDARSLPRLLSLELFNPETDDSDSESSGLSSPESVGSVISVITDQRFSNRSHSGADGEKTTMTSVEDGALDATKAEEEDRSNKVDVTGNEQHPAQLPVVPSSPTVRGYSRLVDGTIAWLMSGTGGATADPACPEDEISSPPTTLARSISEEALDDFVVVTRNGEFVVGSDRNETVDRDRVRGTPEAVCDTSGSHSDADPSRLPSSAQGSGSLCSLGSLGNFEYESIRDYSYRERSASEDTAENSGITAVLDDASVNSQVSRPAAGRASITSQVLHSLSSSRDSLDRGAVYNEVDDDDDDDVGGGCDNGSRSRGDNDSSAGGGAITYHQYYHVFREGELDQLIEKYVENLHIISSYYDHASWCIVAEKVQVWTI